MTSAELDELVRSTMPLCEHLGVVAIDHDDERTVLGLDWAAHLCTIGGALHGGALMALADAAGAVRAVSELPADAIGTTTVSSSTNFVGAAREGRVLATARVVHAGSTTIVVRTELTDQRDRLVATTTQTQLVLRPKP